MGCHDNRLAVPGNLFYLAVCKRQMGETCLYTLIPDLKSNENYRKV